MGMHGYELPNGDVDHRRLVAEARAYAAEEQTRKPAQKFIFLLCKAVERMADKLGNAGGDNA